MVLFEISLQFVGNKCQRSEQYVLSACIMCTALRELLFFFPYIPEEAAECVSKFREEGVTVHLPVVLHFRLQVYTNMHALAIVFLPCAC